MESNSKRGVSFWIPGKPQGKQRPRFTKSGRAYTPKKTKEYEDHIRRCYVKDHKGKFDPLVPLSVTMLVMFSVPKSKSKKDKAALLAGKYAPKKPDADNIAKAVCDALNDVAYHDDCQVVKLKVEKCYSETYEGVWVSMEGLDG